jgi:hypothetical protein
MNIAEKAVQNVIEQDENLVNSEAVRQLLDTIFRRPQTGDGIERSVSITTMDTSSGGTKTDCGCCPRRGC